MKKNRQSHFGARPRTALKNTLPLAFLLLTGFTTSVQATNLLVNPGFELPAGTSYISLPGGSTAITGWTTVLNGVE